MDFKTILKKQGYQLTFLHQEESKTISIECVPRPNYPAQTIPNIKLRILYTHIEPIHKGLTYEIKEVYWWDSINDEEHNLGGRGKLYFSLNWGYLPSEKVWDAFFKLGTNQALNDILWILSKELLHKSAESISASQAIEVLSNYISPYSLSENLEHPALCTEKTGEVSFVSRSMLEYFFCKELNKKNTHSEELKVYISAHSLDYLVYEEKSILLEALRPIQEAKKQTILKKKYVEAAELRDAEKGFIVYALRKHWPDLARIDVDRLREEYLKELGIGGV